MQDVMNEIRDKKSREWLQRLPYKLEIMEPSEESIKAGVCVLSCTMFHEVDPLPP
jgi:rRNA maturation endonuclease Nob1